MALEITQHMLFPSDRQREQRRSFDGFQVKSEPKDATWDQLVKAAVLADIQEGPPHPETMAALAALATFPTRGPKSKNTEREARMEHAERAMQICRIGLQSIPEEHRGPS